MARAGYSCPLLTCLFLGPEGGARSDGKRPCGGEQQGVSGERWSTAQDSLVTPFRDRKDKLDLLGPLVSR